MKKYKTQLLSMDEGGIAKAAAIIQSGGIVAFATETVYGLGASAFSPEAVEKIFQAKGRPQNNPLIVHISDQEQASLVSSRITPKARALMDTLWPGPLSIILDKSPQIPLKVTAGLMTVALRLPAHEGARAFIRACGVPIAAPSANRSGLPSTTRPEHVLADLSGTIPLVLDGGPCQFGLESTVIDMSGELPVLLRPGAVSLEQLEVVIGKVALGKGVMQPLAEGESAKSPGLLHRHYSPEHARVILLQGPQGAMVRYIQSFCKENRHRCAAVVKTSVAEKLDGVLIKAMGEDDFAYANALFDTLRALDDGSVDVIFCQGVSCEGVGMALMNRLLRACGFHVQTLY